MKGISMTTRKPAKSLSDLLDSKPEEETPVSNPEPEVVDDGDSDLVDENEPQEPEEDVTLIPVDQNPVHTWQENHDHNLARVHPDVVKVDPNSDHSSTTRTVTESIYADEAEQDDKGRKGVVSDEEYDRDEDYVEED